MVHAIQHLGERHGFPALCQIFLVRCAGKTNICDGKLLAAPIARALGLSEGPRFQLGAGRTWTPEPGLFPGGWDSPGQARKEDRVSQRTCGHPGRQQQWRTQAASTRMKSQFIFSSEIRWEETVPAAGIPESRAGEGEAPVSWSGLCLWMCGCGRPLCTQAFLPRLLAKKCRLCHS